MNRFLKPQIMSENYFGDLHDTVLRHYREIAAENPAFQSGEWFLLRYLRRIEILTASPSSTEKVENSMRALIRFYIDRIDAQSPMGERCVQIYDEYRKTKYRKQMKEVLLPN